MSVVRENLLARPGYAPYCGNIDCRYRMPRTHFINGQFECACGWRSEFPDSFIQAYREKWGKKT